MIRSVNHSTYPRVDEHPLDQQVRLAIRAREAGRGSEQDVIDAQDEVTTVVVADQARAFVDVVTDGMVRWEGLLAHVARNLDGIEPRGLVRWFDTNFYDRRPAITEAVARTEPFLVRDYDIAQDVAQRAPVKVVMPGPVTFARIARDTHHESLDATAHAVASALAEEVADLVEAGARCFQLDEPLLCRHPEDAERVRSSAEIVWKATGDDDVTILSTYFGDLAPLADALDALPGSHLGLDLVSGPGNWPLLERLPDGKHLVLGLFDARTTRQEDAAEVAKRLEPHREALMRRDVLVGPNAGLELLPRDQAFDKLLHSRYLVEKLTQDWKWDA